MDSMRLLQQRALRQIFQSRPLHPQSAVRHISRNSYNPQQCMRRQHRTLQTSLIPHRPTSRSFFPCVRSTPRSTLRFQSTTTTSSSSQEPLTLSQRMRKLSREYGYAALGVYLALSALDLPFCYLAVSYLGTDRIGRWEHAILSYIKGLVKWPMGREGKDKVDEAAAYVKEKVPLEEVRGKEGAGKRLLEEEETYVKVEDHGYMEAEKADSGENAGFWTKLALAYAIHKSFIFIRVPVTAAVTPKVVKTLRSWGWDIGKKRATKKGVVSGTGVNTGKTGVKPEK